MWQVQAAVGPNLNFDATKHVDSAQSLIKRPDLSNLFLQSLHIKPMSDASPTRVIGDCYILVAQVSGRQSHLLYGIMTITPRGMYVKVAFYVG